MSTQSQIITPSDPDATLTGEEPAIRDRLPDTVGRYALVRVLGAGGGGTVYEAIDPKLDRRVAVKLIPIDERRGRSAARLEREARALGQLSHPNIVTVLDVGRFENHVFITMELVDGEPLDKWRRAQPRSWREIVGVFVQAAAGLQAAHDAGLVHRDFKPSNAMVDEHGRVRVMDFGLVLAVGEPESGSAEVSSGQWAATLSDRLTRTGAMSGTPMYMAPEQFMRAEVTPATDQFAWCLTLYAALYEDDPFDASGVAQRCLAVTRGELRPPSSQGRVPARIWPVIRRGLSTRREDRWPSMQAVSDALERAGRLRRWPLGIAGAAALVAAVATPSLSTPDRVPLVEAALAAAALPETSPFDDRLRRVKEQFRDGDKEGALAEAESIASEAEAAGDTGALLEALRWRGIVLMDARDYSAYGDNALRAYGIATKSELDEHATRAARNLAAYSRLTQDYAAADQWRRHAESRLGPVPDPKGMAEIDFEEGLLASAQGDHARAIELLDAGLGRLEGIAGDTRELEARYRSSLGQLRSSVGDYEEAIRHYEQELALAQDYDGEDDRRAAAAMMNLGITYWQAGDWGAGRRLLERACDSLLSKPAFREQRGLCLLNLSEVEEKLGHFSVAVDHSKRALAIIEEVYGPDHRKTASVHSALGDALFKMGRPDDALPHLERALTILEVAQGSSSPGIPVVMLRIGKARRAAGDLEGARSILRRAQASFSEQHNEKGYLASTVSYARSCDPQEAVRTLESVLAHENFKKLNSYRRAVARFALALRLDDDRRATTLAKEALADAEARDRDAFEQQELLVPLRKWLATRPSEG